MSQCDKTVIPGEPNDVRRDPWFDTLTTLSEVEGESREAVGNRITLNPGSHPASVFAEASPDRPRDLAGMTNCDPILEVEGIIIGGPAHKWGFFMWIVSGLS